MHQAKLDMIMVLDKEERRALKAGSAPVVLPCAPGKCEHSEAQGEYDKGKFGPESEMLRKSGKFQKKDEATILLHDGTEVATNGDATSV